MDEIIDASFGDYIWCELCGYAYSRAAWVAAHTTCPNCGGSHTRMYEDVFNEDVPEAEKLEGIGPIYKITACKSCETILIMVPTGRWRGESKNERTCEFAS